MRHLLQLNFFLVAYKIFETSSPVIGYFADAHKAHAMTCLYASPALNLPDSESSLSLAASTLVRRVCDAGSFKGSLSVLLWNQLPRMRTSNAKLSAEFSSISSAISAVYRELALSCFHCAEDDMYGAKRQERRM